MKKQIRLNAVDMNCVGCCPGLWLHPEDETIRYNTLEYWIELAKLLERGLFDSLFIADVYGIYDVYGGDADAAFRNAAEFPVNDPFLVVPAMAAVTRHLGFGLTGTATYEQPFSFARRVSTLDHLSNGRLAWNIVTGYLDSAAKAFGMTEQLPHDERYVKSDEFMEVVYKLWEGSWEEGAVLRDKQRGIFADPSKTHKVRHEGKYFRMEAYHLCEPSPQRTPILFQAGASSKGREFAAKHAECVFISARYPKVAAEIVGDIRERAAALGRDPKSVQVYVGLPVVCGETDAAAQAKIEDYRKYISAEGTLALWSGYLGIDLASCDLEEPLSSIKINGIQTSVESFTRTDPTRNWTLRDAVELIGVEGHKTRLTGSPATVADGLMGWMEESGLDGFNVSYIVNPGDLTAFVDLVVPELQRRGVYKTQYEEGTLREKLYGRGRRHLPATHPGASYRFPRP